MNVKKITPSCSWKTSSPVSRSGVERFGFQRTADVHDGDKLGFALRQTGTVELMYQSYASADKEVGTTISQVVGKGPTFLYVEVDNLKATISAVKGAEVTMPERKTFSGSREIGIKDPAGHSITFAEFSAQQK